MKVFTTLFLILSLFICVGGVLAADIAYIVSNPNNLDTEEVTIKNFMINEGYTVEVLNDVSFDADDYALVVVGESVNNIDSIFDNTNHKTLFMSNSAAKNAGLSSGSGLSSGKDIVIGEIDFITEGYFLEELRVYLNTDTIKYISGCFPINSQILAYKSESSRTVIQGLERGSLLLNGGCTNRDIEIFERNIYFGLIQATEWNLDAKNMFSKSLTWLLEDEDFDLDGYVRSEDCNDRDENSYPGALEIPYDNIDQDCDGNDLKDVDEDGFDSDNSGGNDCNDEDSQIYPGNTNLLKDCINDAPIINDYTPDTTTVRVVEDTNREFSIIYSDPDSNTLDINLQWKVDGVTLGFGDSFVFNEPIGNYEVKAIVSDGSLTDEMTWSVSVESSGSFTCSQAAGYVCTSNQACEGDLLGVSDSNSCCSVECVGSGPGFDKINNLCTNKNSDIEISFEDLNSNDDTSIGDLLNSRIKVRNRFDEDYDFDVVEYFYDITKNKVIEKFKDTFKLDEGRFEIKDFEFYMEEDLEEAHEYALILIVESENGECNQDFINLDVKRDEHNVIIEDFKIDGNDFICGDTIRTELEIQNIGEEEETVVIKIVSSKLGINHQETVSVEGYGDEDFLKKEIFLDIRDKVAAGTYTLSVEMKYGAKRDSAEGKLTLGECENIEVEQDTVETITLEGVVSEVTDIRKSWYENSEVVIYIFMAVLILGIVGFYGYLGWNKGYFKIPSFKIFNNKK